MQFRELGKTNIEISAIGLGVMQFSQAKGVFKFMFPQISRELGKEIIQAALENNINWFDTAEIYGGGASERSLHQALQDTHPQSEHALVASKWWPIMRTAKNIRKNIGERMENFDGKILDLYQVHQPISLSSVEDQMDEMVKLVKAGKIRSVGVSNYNVEKMKRAHRALAKHNIPLASNQVEYSLLKRDIEDNGVLKAAKDLGITIIAWGPLAAGLLSAKFHQNAEIIANAPLGKKMTVGSRIKSTQPLIDVLVDIANQHQVSPSQIAINWVVTNQGDTVVAIPGASKAKHAKEAATALDFTLSKEDLSKLNNISSQFI